VRSTAAPYTESRLTHLVRNKCVGFPVVEQLVLAHYKIEVSVYRCALPKDIKSPNNLSVLGEIKTTSKLKKQNQPRFSLFLIARYTEYTECQAFCPVVRIGSPTPSPASAAPPLWIQVRRHTRLRGRDWRDPILTKGQTLWYSMYTITLPFRSKSHCLLMKRQNFAY
jgi:hypothetical protein